MNGTYDPWLVMLSIAVAVMASYVALDLASRVTASAGRTARFWLAGGALSMGMGIWSMHFIGMLAFRLPMPMSYSAPITVLSLLIAMVVSGFALHTVSRESLGLRRLSVGGVLMGLGIASMHYTGMAAMRMRPPITYDPALFALSILIAMAASWAALWIAFQLREETELSGFWRKAGSAAVMGGAICGMHYTGMAAAIFSPDSVHTTGGPGLPSVWLAVTIAAFAVVLLTITLFVSVADARRAREIAEHERGQRLLRQAHDQLETRVAERTSELARINAALEAEVAEHRRTEQALRTSEDEARAIVDTAYDAYVAMDADGRVLEWNQHAAHTFGWTRAEVLGRNLAGLIIPLRLRDSHARGLKHFLDTGDGPVLNKRFEIVALHRDGHEFPVELTIWPIRAGASYKFNAFLHDIGARRRGIRRLAAQTAAAAALVESNSVAEAAPKVLEAVATALEWSVGALWIVDSGSDVLRCMDFWHREHFPVAGFEQITRSTNFERDIGLPGRVWSSGKPLWIADVTQDSNFPRARFAAQDGLHAAFAVPIFSGTRVLGVVEFFASSIQQPDPDLLRMMDTLGSLLGQFIERKRAETKLEQDGEFLSALLNNVSEGIVACDERGILTVFNRATQELHGLPAEPLPPEQWAEHYDLYLAGGLTPMPTDKLPLLRAFRGETVHDVEIVVAPKDRPPRTLVCNGQALITASGEKLGAVVVMHDITARKEAEARLIQLAQFDPLTGLPNRRQFYESLRTAMALADSEHWQIPILFLDLDRFKDVNDTLGHVVGDELLRQVGERLVGCLRVRDTVGRLGGDEFGIILITPRDPQLAADIAQKLIDALRLPFELEGREVTVTTSIGITVYPVDSIDLDTLIRFADTAMYEAKAAGRDTYRFYTAEMNARALAKLDLESALRRALERGEFVLHYQPKMDIASGQYTGAEALLRWERPGVGLVAPDAFIPALEETGLIEQVGGWVIDEACRQLVEWRVAGIGPQRIAVNVSARQVMRVPIKREEPLLPSPYACVVAESIALELAVAVARREHGIAAGQLELELTESTLMSHAELNVSLLQRLKAQGVTISIDDFGTGYSSLAYLKRFPIDTIKIDRAFIRDITSDPDAAAIVIAIISLAHSLKLKVIAEGVETREQLEFLGANGCDEAQGFHVARPMPAEDLMRFFVNAAVSRQTPD